MDNINKSFALGLIGFDNDQKETFLAILSLAERRLKHEWHIVEPENADFFLCAFEKSDSEILIVENKLPVERCLFYSTRDNTEINELSIDDRLIPRLGSLVEILNKISNVGLLESAVTPSPIIPPVVEANIINNSLADHFFTPEQSLLKYLLPDTNEKYFLWIFKSSLDTYKLYIDKVAKTYFCEAELKTLGSCLVIQDDILVRTISKAELDTKPETLAVKPLNNLIWYVTFKLSNGRLLNGHSSQDSVYLTRWPDLGVQECGRYVKLAAFMRNNAICLIDVANKTGVTLNEVYDFYNACYLVGIIQKTAQPEPHIKNIDEDKQQLLEKITNRLKKINCHDQG